MITDLFTYHNGEIRWKYPELHKTPKPVFDRGGKRTPLCTYFKGEYYPIEAVLGALILNNERADIIFLDGNKLNTELDNLAVKELLMDETITTKPIKELML